MPGRFRTSKFAPPSSQQARAFPWGDTDDVTDHWSAMSVGTATMEKTQLRNWVYGRPPLYRTDPLSVPIARVLQNGVPGLALGPTIAELHTSTGAGNTAANTDPLGVSLTTALTATFAIAFRKPTGTASGRLFIGGKRAIDINTATPATVSIRGFSSSTNYQLGTAAIVPSPTGINTLIFSYETDDSNQALSAFPAMDRAIVRTSTGLQFQNEKLDMSINKADTFGLRWQSTSASAGNILDVVDICRWVPRDINGVPRLMTMSRMAEIIKNAQEFYDQD